MNTLPGLQWPFSHVVIDRFGWVLVHSLWQFAALGLLGAGMMRLLRRSSSNAKYVALVTVLSVTAVAPVATWLLIPVPSTVSLDSLVAERFPSAEISVDAVAMPAPASAPVVDPGGSVPEQPGQPAAVVSTLGRPSARSVGQRISLVLKPLLPLIVGAWCLGVLICSLRPLLGWRLVQRLRRIGILPPSEEVMAALDRVSQRMKMKHAIHVFCSTLAKGPLVVGYLRPIVLLPVSFVSSVPMAQLEAILAHELAHIRRHDFVINLLQTLVETLFFYHPIIWWLSHRIRLEREHCCDDLVVKLFNNRVDYGRALVAVEQLPGRETSMALGARDGALLGRIRRILGAEVNSSADRSRSMFPMLLCLLTVASVASMALSGFADPAVTVSSQTSDGIDQDGQSVGEKGGAADPKRPAKPLVGALPDGRSVEFVGITKNTRPASEGWRPDGRSISDVGYWPSTMVLHGGNTSGSYVENGPHPEPDANAADFLFRFRGLKSQPSLTFRLPTNGISYPHLPVKDPYEIRVSGRVRDEPPPSAEWKNPDGVVRVGLTDEPWGKWLQVSPAGETINPLSNEDLYRQSYEQVRIEGVESYERTPDGNALVLIQPQNCHSLYSFQIRGIDENGEKQWVLEWESGTLEGSEFRKGKWGLASSEKKTLARYEFRLRPYRHWVTFEGVSTEPGNMSRVKVSVESLPPEEIGTPDSVSSDDQTQEVDKPVSREQTTARTDDNVDPGGVGTTDDSDADTPNADSVGDFSGHVTGPDGQPFAGANIFVVSNTSGRKKPGPVRAKTDTNGRFEFNAPDMTYAGYDGLPKRREGLIFATADGFAPEWMVTWGNNTSTFHEYWTPRKGAKIELQLAVDDVPIHARFLDADGRPLVGARVRLTKLMVPGNRDLTAHLDHWSKASVTAGFLTKAPSYKRELGLTNLIPGLTVDSVTDADGRITLKGLGRDRLARLKITAPSVLDTRIEVMARDAANVGTFLDLNGKPTQTVYGANFTLQLKRGLTVTGIVRDRDNKQPIAGMWVTKRYNPLTHPAYSDGIPVTDENGRFTFTGLDPALLTSEKKHRRLTAIPQPGMQYLQARGVIGPDADMVIECVRGISYRLKLVDEDGKPVAGTVEYRAVSPNPLSKNLVQSQMAAMNRAALQPDGTYKGFVLPGPGAVMVEMPNRRAYRPAFVEPKAFFAPERTKWTRKNERSYGTRDTLNLYGGQHDQNRSSAIVLVNPQAGSGSLALTATVYRDRPRQVSLVDPDGKPIVDVDSRVQWPGRESREKLRSATFSVTGLHPNRVKQMTFIKADRQLIAILLARGDGDTPYTVQMQPWCTVTGRIVDESGNPLVKQTIIVRATNDGVTRYSAGKSDKDGRFRIGTVIPGLTYNIEGRVDKPPYVSVDGQSIPPLTLTPGEVRDIGDVRIETNWGCGSRAEQVSLSFRSEISRGDNTKYGVVAQMSAGFTGRPLPGLMKRYFSRVLHCCATGVCARGRQSWYCGWMSIW